MLLNSVARLFEKITPTTPMARAGEQPPLSPLGGAHEHWAEAVDAPLLDGGAPPAKGVAPFLLKLYNIVSDEAFDGCVRWSSEAGDVFTVTDQHVFTSSVLPKFFKHASMSSFMRQLNTYGFKKLTRAGRGSEMLFSNSQFRRGRLDLLRRIKRSTPAAPSTEPVRGEHATIHDLAHLNGQINALIAEVRDMRQCVIDTRGQIDALRELDMAAYSNI